MVHEEKPINQRTKENLVPAVSGVLQTSLAPLHKKINSFGQCPMKVLFACSTQWRNLHNRIRRGKCHVSWKRRIIIELCTTLTTYVAAICHFLFLGWWNSVIHVFSENRSQAESPVPAGVFIIVSPTNLTLLSKCGDSIGRADHTSVWVD